MKLSRELVEIESLLDGSVRRLDRAISNMLELKVSGLPTSTPGNGSPGGGKGAGRAIMVESDRVPVSAVEAMAINSGPDVAARALAELTAEVDQAAAAGTAAVEAFLGQTPVEPGPGSRVPVLAMHALRCSRVLVHLDVPERWRPGGGWGVWLRPSRRIWQLTQGWGWVPAEPAPKVQRQRELLAADMTGQWCRSCLRAGVRAPRDRNAELCSWCRKFFAVEGFLPPLELATARSEGRRITEQMVLPHRQANRDRIKQAKQGR